MQEIDDIKRQIVKKAIIFETGGFKPSYSDTESWIGNVYLYKEQEELPHDEHANLMIPLFQLCLDGLENVPEVLADTKVITVFMGQELPMDVTANGHNWMIREYKKADNLVIKQLQYPESTIKPFPLKPQYIKEDYPIWDGGGLTSEMEETIIRLENEGVIPDYYEIAENQYGHKLGGYPSFCQPGVDFGEDFEFVFQIASDDKANLNIIDSGTMYFAKNTKTGEWVFYCDFY